MKRHSRFKRSIPAITGDRADVRVEDHREYETQVRGRYRAPDEYRPTDRPALPSRSCVVALELGAPRYRFVKLVAGIPIGDAKKLDNAHGSFMAVSVDHLGRDSRGGALYAVAHRYEVNGDLVPDPDVEFYVIDDPAQPGAKAIYPTAIDQGALGYSTDTFTSTARACERQATSGLI